MKAYKGFNKDMTCRGFQYEPGKSYEMGGPVEVCKSGFHACEDPLDVFKYYAPGNSRYFEVYPGGDIERDTGDSKLACSRIKIGAELDIRKLVRAKIEYVKEHTTTEHTDPKQATAGDSGAATAGNYGAATAGNSGAATAGYRGAATAGDSGAATAGNSGAATAGYRGAATAGYRGASGAATAGYRGAATAGTYGAATAGDSGAATAGNYGAATAGDSGAATSRGAAAVGAYGIACARGIAPRVRGGIGAVLVLGQEDEDTGELTCWKAVVVDDKDVKADTWYTLKDGEFAEWEEESE